MSGGRFAAKLPRCNSSARHLPAPAVTPGADSLAVWLDGVHKTYGKGENAVHALQDVTLGFAPGESTAAWPSARGKSTFLHVAAGLYSPTGSACLRRNDLAGLTRPGSPSFGASGWHSSSRPST